MLITGLCGPKKKDQVPTTPRRGRQLKTMQESLELWKAEHKVITQGIARPMQRMLRYAKRAGCHTRHSSNPEDFSEEGHVVNFRSEKSIFILLLLNGFVLPSSENKPDLFLGHGT